MTTIEFKNLTFGFDTQASYLFDQTHLVLQSEWRLGLVGRNGRGKTTLLRLLMGDYHYKGKIEHQLDFIYFPQKVTDKTKLTYDVLQDLSHFELWKIEKEITLLNMNLDSLWRPFESLSGGEQTKILLALLFVDDQHYPLIDEPTNHLDATSRQQVARYLHDKQQGFIVVSHDQLFIDQVVDHVLAIEKSQLLLYQGDFSTYLEQKHQRDQFESAQNEKLKKEISRLKQAAVQKAEWSRGRERDKLGSPNQPGSGAIFDTGAIGARSARMMKRSQTMMKRMRQQADEKAQLLKDVEYVKSLHMNVKPSHRQKILTVEHLQLSYNNQPLFDPISFEIQKGQRLAIQGSNGSGKSSIIQYLFDAFHGEATGITSRLQGLAVSYLSQDYDNNQGTLREFADQHALNYSDFLNNLWQLGVERQVFQNRIEDMSMGQRKRVALAQSLVTPAELFIWDEPLNYLDIFNQQQLEAVIQKMQPTMLIIEHDRHFLKNVATKTLTLSLDNGK